MNVTALPISAFVDRFVTNNRLAVTNQISKLAVRLVFILLFLTTISAVAQTGNEWAWMSGSNRTNSRGVYGTPGVPAATNIPGARIGPQSWTDKNGNLWLFGGAGRDANGQENVLNDLWEYQISSGEWTWVSGSSVGSQSGIYGNKGVAAAGNAPGGRYLATSWVDKSGNFWIFGGFGADSVGNQNDLNDLWMYNITSGLWTWEGGSQLANQNGVWGTLGTPAKTNIPSARTNAAGWTDKSGNLWLFGGSAIFADNNLNTSDLNDLWEYNITTGNWTWVAGSHDGNSGIKGIYGTPGTPSTANIPGGRDSSATWTDSSGNLWLFGGTGYDADGTDGLLNDLWEYNPSKNEWTWISGNDIQGQPGIYGSLGTPAETNIPGSRGQSVSWLDKSGNLWLLGGEGYDSVGTTSSKLNDLWEYSPSTNQWIWIDGSKIAGESGNYGTLGILAASNIPGGRYNATSLTDSNGNFWLFGGFGIDSEGIPFWLNDLWEYRNFVNTTTSLTSSSNPAPYGTSLTFTATVSPEAGTNPPTGTIQFSVNNSPVGSPVTLDNGEATYITSTLAVGTSSITAVYTPLVGSAFTASSATALNQVVKIAAQTIAFTQPTSPVRYGVTPIALSVSASSGLPVTLNVTGPATLNVNTLTITGVGTVVVRATQAGNTDYSAAAEVTKEIVVDKASLTVTATSSSVVYNLPIPTLTYTVTGFVNGDTSSVLSGAPVETTTATQGLAAGKYPITITKGTLAAANYGGFVMVNGTMTILATQTIAFTQPTSPVRYGVTPITLTATATSNLPVTYTVTGPGTLVGSTVKIIGVGTVVIKASQVGNNSYAAATTVTKEIVVDKASLTVTANNASVVFNQPLPALAYTVTGFVNGDTTTVLTGAPVETTTAKQGSAAGKYPIDITKGTLSATNYGGFVMVNGTLTITQ